MQRLFYILTLALVNLLGPVATAQEFRNPVINADYSDPDIIRVGDDYYMTASSFVNTPGLPILHSKDLVNWEIVNHALTKVPPYEYYDAAPRHGKGVWAPSIRHHDGIYYIYWGDPDFGIFMVKSDDPRGQWSEPVLVKAGKGMIDPTPLWDDDGRVYMVHAWAGSRIGFNSVVTIFELNADGTAPISEPVMVFDGNDGVNHTVEGPKLYKRDGWYYIFAPAGGVVDGWQIVARSKNIYGPYESRIVMMQGDTDINGPHQGGWVDTPDGNDWFLHFQDKGVYGRVTHLNPMVWRDGWPVIGKDNGGQFGTPMRKCQMPVKGTKQNVGSQRVDDFTSYLLAPEWEWSGNKADWFGFGTNRGFYRLNAAQIDTTAQNLWDVPNLLLQKFPGDAFTATAELVVNSKETSLGFVGGLVVFGYDYGYIGVQRQGEGFALVQATCIDSDQGNAEEVSVLVDKLPFQSYEAGLHPNLKCNIWLRAQVTAGGQVKFAYSLDGKKFKDCGQSFQSRQGKWVGAKIGLFATVPQGTERGWLDVRQFTLNEVK